MRWMRWSTQHSRGINLLLTFPTYTQFCCNATYMLLTTVLCKNHTIKTTGFKGKWS